MTGAAPCPRASLWANRRPKGGPLSVLKSPAKKIIPPWIRSDDISSRSALARPRSALGPRTMTNTVVLKVAMMCTGCSGAVERVLGKMEGVQSFDVNLETQKVTVVGTVTQEEVVAKIAKTGKTVEPWSD